ncbi:ArfGap-domain-containing protein [Daldinia caldariorum]|uniref:ArfGap-domain-containing protein n=1 Tax=Daldinia caldariorum TaxID=326644 RepID=UPI00200745BF|nr:ArfGap-domain-containing protein [Daldinia caldariorum]KAI1465926.1 ArfGap-domain-containing protein [Daldinia caldariorum]
MSALMSKRQQARNEKALQDLVHNVPGNNFCADCQARNPSWASWNLGVFLCMRCAAIHRKLGTHISKVKSLSMDSWSNDQVETMKRMGNDASNKIYNPQNKKPPVPIDADEADSAMERFIRAKYVQKAVNGTKKHNTGSSDEGTPPPLPPKTGSRFFSFRSKKETRPRESVFGVHDPPRSPDQSRNKTPNTFGASVHQDTVEDTAQKLTQLRDMGFMDDKRNAMVLKGVNGNIEKTIEALVRLGEGGGGPPLSLPSRDSSRPPPTSRSLTPQPLTPRTAPTIGLSRSSPQTAPSPASPASNNPWDIQPAQPQSSQSTGTLQNRNPFYSSNPFDMPSQQPDFNLNQSMQNLSIAPAPQQALFPHHTGGLPTHQPLSQPFYSQPMTAPIQQTPGFMQPSFTSSQTFPQLPSQQTQSYNPFLQAPANLQPSLSLNTTSPFQNQGSLTNNPFTRSPTKIASPTLNQIPEQSQQNFYNASHSAYASNANNASNPFFTTSRPVSQPTQAPAPVMMSQPAQQAWYEPQPLAQVASQPVYQQQQQQLPPRPNTASILALYNYPQLAPARPQAQDQSTPGTQVNQTAPTPTQPQQPHQAQTQQNTAPQSGSKNPFMHSAAATPVPNTNGAPSPFAVPSNPNSASSGARSRESMTLGMEMAWNNGRHSPDAFASLSARSG